MAGLSLAETRIVHDFAVRSASEILDRHFKGDLAKALFGFDGVVGNFASPQSPGTAYVLLHHLFGEAAGVPGAWGHAIGGMGSITQAMARACREAGVDIVLNTPVEEVIVDRRPRRRASSPAARRGARKASSPASIRSCCSTGWCRAARSTRDVASRMHGWKCESATFRMNVALSELPKFTVLPKKGNHLTAGIIMAPSLDYMHRAWLDAAVERLGEAADHRDADPSTLDRGSRPRASTSRRCSASISATISGRGEAGTTSARRPPTQIIATVDSHAPGFAKSVLGRQIHSPLDLERRFGLIGGDIFHGKMGLDQLFSARPMIGAADYRMPLKGLYLCGSGAHPGGGVTGAPGHNAARAVLADRRFWKRRH